MISYAEQKTLLIKTRESVSLIRVLDDENKPIVGTLYLNCLSNSKKRFFSDRKFWPFEDPKQPIGYSVWVEWDQECHSRFQVCSEISFSLFIND